MLIIHGPIRYRRAAHEADAILFDGTNGDAISRFFGFDVADQGDRVSVATGCGRVYAGAGCWVVRDCATRRLSVIDDREFAAMEFAAFEPINDVVEATIGSGNVFADLGLPDADALLADSRRIEAERAGLPVVRLGGH